MKKGPRFTPRRVRGGQLSLSRVSASGREGSGAVDHGCPVLLPPYTLLRSTVHYSFSAPLVLPSSSRRPPPVRPHSWSSSTSVSRPSSFHDTFLHGLGVSASDRAVPPLTFSSL